MTKDKKKILMELPKDILVDLVVKGDEIEKTINKKYLDAVADYEYEKYKNSRAIEYIESYNLPDNLGILGEAPITLREVKEILEILKGETNE